MSEIDYIDIHVRLYRHEDAQTLAQLFFDSVRNGTTAFYTTEQREAWG